MANLTPFLNLVKPLETEDYNIDDFNDNADLLDTIIATHNADILEAQAFLYRSSTINHYPTTAAEFRTLIETLPKNLNGKSVVIQMPNAGSYFDFSADLTLKGFHAGMLTINFPAAISGSVYLRFSSGSKFIVTHNNCPVIINNPRIARSGTGSTALIQDFYSKLYFTGIVSDSYVIGNDESIGIVDVSFADFYSSSVSFQNTFSNCNFAINAGAMSRIVTNNNTYPTTWPVKALSNRGVEHYELSDNEIVYRYDSAAASGVLKLLVDYTPHNLNGKTVRYLIEDLDIYFADFEVKGFHGGNIVFEGIGIASEALDFSTANDGLHFLENSANLSIIDLCVKKDGSGNAFTFQKNTGNIIVQNYGVKSGYNGIYAENNSKVFVDNTGSSDCSANHFKAYDSEIIVYATMTYTGVAKYAYSGVNGHVMLRDGAAHYEESTFSSLLSMNNAGAITARMYKMEMTTLGLNGSTPIMPISGKSYKVWSLGGVVTKFATVKVMAVRDGFIYFYVESFESGKDIDDFIGLNFCTDDTHTTSVCTIGSTHSLDYVKLTIL